MFEKYSQAMKLLYSIALFFFLFATIHGAEEVTNADASANKGSNSNNLQQQQQVPYYPKFKRAWNQLHGAGWGKRSENELENESMDQLQQLIRMYADQLLANRLDDDTDYFNGENDIDKRAKWSQLQSGWGKRDWNQLRGK